MTLPRKIVLASGNAGKIRELASLLDNMGVEIIAQSEMGVTEADETGATFAENSLIKARHASKLSGLPAIADDSGLAVDALGGSPGVFSARFAGAHASDDANIDKLLHELKHTPKNARSAAFLCAATFVAPGQDAPLVASGEWRGSILAARMGHGGFGYDPVFLDPQSGGSAAFLSGAEKNARSHRGQALRELVELIRQTYL